MSEKRHEDELAKWLKAHGHGSERLVLPGKRGFPDRTVWLADGRTAYVEMKKPGVGRLSIHQKRWKDKLQKLNQPWAACWSAEEAIEFVEGLLQ